VQESLQELVPRILAAEYPGIDKSTLAHLRGECAKEVRRMNGSFLLEDAIEWQKRE